GKTAGVACSAGSGRSRCRLRFAHDRQESGANGRNAVLQMDRQPDPDHFPKLDAANEPVGVSLRLSPVCHPRARATAVRMQKRGLSFFTPDYIFFCFEKIT